MRFSKPITLLALLALVWVTPVRAEAPPLLCLADTAPSAEPALGNPSSLPAQTCGPCLLEFCAEIGVRCTFSSCGINNCCRYSCECDLSCTTSGTAGGACLLRLPENCLCGNGVADMGEDCDDPDLRGETCVSQGFDGGTLACTSGCAFDTTDCYRCGDGTCEGPEDCESCPADCDSQTTGNPNQRFCCGNGTPESAEGMSCSVCDGNC